MTYFCGCPLSTVCASCVVAGLDNARKLFDSASVLASISLLCLSARLLMKIATDKAVTKKTTVAIITRSKNLLLFIIRFMSHPFQIYAPTGKRGQSTKKGRTASRGKVWFQDSQVAGFAGRLSYCAVYRMFSILSRGKI